MCDNESAYPFMTKSRDFCARSHGRYSACGSHYDSKHHKKGEPEDWRSCTTCNTDLGFNAGSCFNWLPPKYALDDVLVDECVKCNKLFIGHFTGKSLTEAGIVCPDCRPIEGEGGIGMVAIEMSPAMLDRLNSLELGQGL